MWRFNEHCVLVTFCEQPQDSGHINHVALQGIVSWPHSVDSRRTVDTSIMWRYKDNTWGQADGCSRLYVPHITSIKRGWGEHRRFWVRPTTSKRKAHGGDELLVDLRNDGVGLSGDVRSSFDISF
jgi:hypothetical protein